MPAIGPHPLFFCSSTNIEWITTRVARSLPEELKSIILGDSIRHIVHIYYQKFNEGTRISKFFEGVHERERLETPDLECGSSEGYIVSISRVTTMSGFSSVWFVQTAGSNTHSSWLTMLIPAAWYRKVCLDCACSLASRCCICLLRLDVHGLQLSSSQSCRCRHRPRFWSNAMPESSIVRAYNGRSCDCFYHSDCGINRLSLGSQFTCATAKR